MNARQCWCGAMLDTAFRCMANPVHEQLHLETTTSDRTDLTPDWAKNTPAIRKYSNEMIERSQPRPLTEADVRRIVREVLEGKT